MKYINKKIINKNKLRFFDFELRSPLRMTRVNTPATFSGSKPPYAQNDR